jgi:CO/xanthine dehydrogenase FAD-binding subunit
MNWVAYRKPKSIAEALALLGEADGRGRLIAGGTDLMLQLRHHEYRPDLLVDITGIEELKQIEENDGWIEIGAAVTHGEVAKNSVIQKEARALAEGCARVGSPQIRNMATLVGNVISAQPAADGAIPLAALEAEMKVVSKDGERWVSVEATYKGVGVSSVDASREVATKVRFKKLGEKGQTRFFRMCRRKALALPPKSLFGREMPRRICNRRRLRPISFSRRPGSPQGKPIRGRAFCGAAMCTGKR